MPDPNVHPPVTDQDPAVNSEAQTALHQKVEAQYQTIQAAPEVAKHAIHRTGRAVMEFVNIGAQIKPHRDK